MTTEDLVGPLMCAGIRTADPNANPPSLPCKSSKVHLPPAFTTLQAIPAFVVPVVLCFVQLKFQGKSTSPYEAHPFDTFLALVSLLLYGAFAIVTLLAPACCALLFRILMVLAVALSVASLAALLIPGPFHYFPYLLLLAFLSMVLLYLLGRTLLMWVQHKLESMLVAVFRYWRIHGGRAAPFLPLTIMDARSAPEFAQGLARKKLD
ncbi:hypothetical protein BT93_H1292 [Corymbia citriodora subsp. variegata]|nr:hypothetical protein BT93_H1292 [Corymbia citriodora subsp. variegata]